MAKQNYLKLAVVIVLTMAASSVYAATGTPASVGTSIGGSSFAASNKVSCFYDSNGTSGSFDGSEYAIACGHTSGDKVVAAKSGDAKLYFTAVTANSAAVSASTAATTGFSTTGWISM
jgi:hypothetical protein